MVDPVILASDGVTYERTAIVAWLDAHGAVSPTTGAALENKELIP